MKLSKRLEAVADYVTEGSKICDVGTDHGFLPIELVKSGKIQYAIAMDINNGPLERAVRHVAECQLEDRIECRISDGLDRLNQEEADCAVIAGMGGDLISEIINRCPDKVNELILSPHTHYETVRRTLRKNRFRIIAEKMIIEDNKFYLIIKAKKSDSYSEMNNNGCCSSLDIYDYFGEYLIKNKNEILIKYLLHEEEKYRIIPQKSQYLSLVRDALKEIRND